jgi:hypothetical protein
MYRSYAGVYGPSKPSSWSPIGAWLTSTGSLVGSGRETRYGPACRSAGVLWIMSGVLFLGSSGIRPNLSASHKRLLYVDHVRYVWSWTILGLSTESMWHVGQVFPCRVYIDSNRRDSRILVTAYLWKSSCR